MNCPIPRQSKSKQIADLIASEIQNRFAFQTISKLAPSFDLTKISGREVSVWPATRTCEAMTRDSQQADYGIAIVLLERLSPTDNEDILADELLAVVEAIGDELLGERLTIPNDQSDDPTIEVLGYDHEPLYDRPMLESHRIFGAAITLNLTRQETLPNR